MAFACQRKRIALGRVEIAEQSSDRSVDVEVDIHLFSVDQPLARMQAQHLANEKLASGPEGERDMLPALQRKGRSRQSRHIDVYRRQCLQPDRRHFAVTGRKVDRAIVHRSRQRLIHQMHDELPAAVNVARGVLRAEIGLVLQAEHQKRRILGEDVEEAERRRVDAAVLVERRDQRDRPRHDDPAQQLVAVLRIELAERDSGHLVFRRQDHAGLAGDQAVMLGAAMGGEIEDRLLAETGSVEIAGMNQ